MAKTPYGEMIVTALLFALLFDTTLATTVHGWIAPLINAIPANWLAFGTYSLAVIGALIGAVVGYFIYRT